MTEYTRKKAQIQGIPETSTPETLEADRFCYGKVIKYGNFTIATAWSYNGKGQNEYYWAAYRNEGGIEDPAHLEAISSDRYEDDGHALQAAFNWITQQG